MSNQSFEGALTGALVGTTPLQGMGISFTSTTSLTVAPGQCVDTTGNFQMVIPTGGLVLSFGTVGANGLDTGTIAANKVYAIYLIGDQSYRNPPVLMASLNVLNTPVMPQLPSGTGAYNIIRRIGWWTSNGSSLLYSTLAQTILYHGARYYQYNTPITVGTITLATSLTEQTFVTAPANLLTTFQAIFTPNSAANVVKMSPVSTSTTGITFAGGGTTTAENTPPFSVVTGNDATTTSLAAVWLISTSASDALTLNVVGFYDSL